VTGKNVTGTKKVFINPSPLKACGYPFPCLYAMEVASLFIELVITFRLSGKTRGEQPEMWVLFYHVV